MKGLCFPGSLLIIPALFLQVLLSGCKNEKSSRSYREIEIQPKRQAVAPMSAEASKMMKTPEDALELTWENPEGWTEEKGSGMRLTTFFFNDNNKTAECTIIMLPGDAGGVVNNVSRWMKQLNIVVPADEEMKKFLDKQDRLTTLSGFNGIVVDFSTLLSGSLISSKTSYTAMIHMQGNSVFVKLVGDKSLLQKNKEKFLGLCKSLKFSG